MTDFFHFILLLELIIKNIAKLAKYILKSMEDGKSSIVRLRSLSDKEEFVKLAFPAREPTVHGDEEGPAHMPYTRWE